MKKSIVLLGLSALLLPSLASCNSDAANPKISYAFTESKSQYKFRANINIKNDVNDVVINSLYESDGTISHIYNERLGTNPSYEEFYNIKDDNTSKFYKRTNKEDSFVDSEYHKMNCENVETVLNLYGLFDRNFQYGMSYDSDTQLYKLVEAKVVSDKNDYKKTITSLDIRVGDYVEETGEDTSSTETKKSTVNDDKMTYIKLQTEEITGNNTRNTTYIINLEYGISLDEKDIIK